MRDMNIRTRLLKHLLGTAITPLNITKKFCIESQSIMDDDCMESQNIIVQNPVTVKCYLAHTCVKFDDGNISCFGDNVTT